MLSLLTLASQQLVSFFFSCVNGVNIKIATKINNTCIFTYDCSCLITDVFQVGLCNVMRL